jgi:hypothetical protein
MLDYDDAAQWYLLIVSIVGLDILFILYGGVKLVSLGQD